MGAGWSCPERTAPAGPQWHASRRHRAQRDIPVTTAGRPDTTSARPPEDTLSSQAGRTPLPSNRTGPAEPQFPTQGDRDTPADTRHRARRRGTPAPVPHAPPAGDEAAPPRHPTAFAEPDETRRNRQHSTAPRRTRQVLLLRSSPPQKGTINEKARSPYGVFANNTWSQGD